MSHKKAILITCIAALIWSIAGLNIKMIQWTPYAIAGGRSLTAAVLLTPLVFRHGRVRLNWYVMGGALCYVGLNYCFIISTKLTTSATAVMMQYTAPIYVALLSRIFLGEKIRRADLVSMAFVFGGMTLFFIGKTGGGTWIGNAVAALNGLFFAGISIFLRLQKEGNPVLSMYFGNVIAAVLGLPFFAAVGLPDGKSLVYLIAAGFLTAFSYSIYAEASKKLTALEAVLLPIIDPVMNPVWVFLFLGERPGILSVMGMVLVLSTVTLRVVWGIQGESAPQSPRATD